MAKQLSTERAKAPSGAPNAPPHDEADSPCRQWRAPQHERGRRRVDAILDAASAILLEGGAEALSVDAVAKRSGTSKSSMYHFFPDRDAIVRALAERHAAQLQTEAGFAPADPVDWAHLTVEETVDRYLEPFRHYTSQHPDFIPCMRAAAQHTRDSQVCAELDTVALQRAERLVGARAPHLKPAERRARTAALVAVKVGVMDTMSRLAPVAPAVAVLRELREVLIAYLTRMEQQDRAADRLAARPAAKRAATKRAPARRKA